jgi:hypothetical protein
MFRMESPLSANIEAAKAHTVEPVIVTVDEDRLLARCTHYLARDNTDPRHNFGQYSAQDPRGLICEAWRFPWITSHGGATDTEQPGEVTFIFRRGQRTDTVRVWGTFCGLLYPLDLTPVGETLYSALTVLVGTRQLHYYRLQVNGQMQPDPINPQRERRADGIEWSRFFTQGCVIPLTFSRSEWVIVDRLSREILPFHTEAGARFIGSQQKSDADFYRLDESVGVANYIDKVLAREEAHLLRDYRTCLAIVSQLFRSRYPGYEPEELPRETYLGLYTEIADAWKAQRGGDPPLLVSDWDYLAYPQPWRFLQHLRRHAMTGAFCHPKYGGNLGAAGWAYLSERYQADGVTLFDWARSIEKPLGRSEQYRG